MKFFVWNIFDANQWTGTMNDHTTEEKHVMFFLAVPCCFKGYFARWIFHLGGYEKTWHMTQLTFSSNFYWNICFKFCILEQTIATVLFICISSTNNKRSLLRFQSTTVPTNRGWSACAQRVPYVKRIISQVLIQVLQKGLMIQNLLQNLGLYFILHKSWKYGNCSMLRKIFPFR